LRLKTRRLLLRPVVLSDAPFFFKSGTSPGVALYAGFPEPKSVATTRAYLRSQIAGWKKPAPTPMLFSIVRRGVWVGGINVRWPHVGVAEVGYSVDPEFWGRGYATEALKKLVDVCFRELGAHRVQATTWIKNKRSQRVLAKSGLKREGFLRGYLKREGVVRDEYIYGLARADWR
jgi:[ribosomal protein S5]-alanine N-acetyltransferase